MSNAFANDPYAKAFDINVSGSMTKIEGRILDPPSLGYKGGWSPLKFIDSFSGRF
jgi:Argonaute linker 2 domain